MRLGSVVSACIVASATADVRASAPHVHQQIGQGKTRRHRPRRRLTDNGATVGGCCKCPGTTSCYHIIAACDWGSTSCCYGGYGGSIKYCNPQPQRPWALAAVSPYTVGAFGSTECAANSVAIPATHSRLCIKAAKKTSSAVVSPSTASVSAYPPGCSTNGRATTRSWMVNTGTGAGHADYQTVCTGGGYAYSKANTNACPRLGVATATPRLFVRINNKPYCETALTALGLDWTASPRVRTSFSSNYPKACAYDDDTTGASNQADRGVWFSEHLTGSAKTSNYPICGAADYFLSAAGSSCAAPRFAIKSVDACKAAAAAMGVSYAGHGSDLDYCYMDAGAASGNAVWFNTGGAGTGSGSTSVKSLCTQTYTYGTAGVNGCLGTDTSITTLVQCQLAANALGVVGTESGTRTLAVKQITATNHHKGCFIDDITSSVEMTFNADASGGANTWDTTVCIAGTPATTVTVASFTPPETVAGTATMFTAIGTKFVSIGLPYVKVIAPGAICDAMPVLGTAVVQLNAHSSPVETSATFTLTFDASAGASSGNQLCWSTSSGGSYELLAAHTIAVTLPPQTISAFTPSTVTVNVPTTLTFTGAYFVTTGNPWIKIVPPSKGCTDAAVAGGTARQLDELASPSETSATLEVTLATAQLSCSVCWSPTQAGTYEVVTTSTINVAAAPTFVPTTAAPTSAPSTSSPSVAPSTAPTMRPTAQIGAIAAEARGTLWVREDGADAAVVLTLYPERALAVGLDERATIQCVVTGGDLEIVGSGVAHIEPTGGVTPVGATTIAVRGVPDATQGAMRLSSVQCDVTTPSGRKQSYTIPVAVRGVNQPSYKLLCPIARGVDPLKVDPSTTTCSDEMTTNGNVTFVIFGGDCATCPQPPFDATTKVRVGGVLLESMLVAGSAGKRILARAPTVAEILNGGDPSSFEFACVTPARSVFVTAACSRFLRRLALHSHATSLLRPMPPSSYYGISITSDGDAASGLLGGSVVATKSAPRSAGTRLACASRGLCPDLAPERSGVYYTATCLGFADATDPETPFDWNSADDAEAALFAIGDPAVGCCACPPGCRCPGGRRCRAVDGYYLDGEDLQQKCADAGPAIGPAPCHLDPVIAEMRCKRYDKRGGSGKGGSVCFDGTTGLLCAECKDGWYSENGDCLQCKPADTAIGVVLYIALVFATTFAVCFALVALVQSYYGNSLQSGAVRSLNFAGWVCSALATQSQIGRTSGGNQPDALRDWYRLLKLFEFNPEGARPAECSVSVSTISFIALLFGIALPLCFMLLSAPALQDICVRMGEAIIISIQGAMLAAKKMATRKKKAKEAIQADLENECENSIFFADAVHDLVLVDEDGGKGGLESSMVHNPMREQRKARARAASQRTEIELVLVGQKSSKSSLAGKSAGEAADTLRIGGGDVASFGEAPVEASDRADDEDRIVANKRARLTGLFQVQRDTIFETWELDDLAAAAAKTGTRFTPSSSDSERTCCARLRPCRRQSTKSSSTARPPPKTARVHSTIVFGNIRRTLLGATVLIHPLVANSAVRAIYCTAHPLSGVLVLASSPGVECFKDGHWRAFILAIGAIVVEMVALPIFIIFALGTTGGWWECVQPCASSAKDVKEEQVEANAITNAIADGDERDVLGTYGRVHGGVCCRCTCCVQLLARVRRNFVFNHDKDEFRVRHLSYSSFLFNDYKPEFFFIRLLYVCSITVIAFCNGFLDPLNLLATPPGVDAAARVALLVTMQTARFVICVAVVALPCVTILALLPNKDGSRWKMPLRVIFALLSFGMLALNAFSWVVQQAGDEAGAGLRGVNTAFSWVVLIMSMLSLLAMAVAFVIFVVFRGAKVERLQIKLSEADCEEKELAVLAHEVLLMNQVQRAFNAWRSGDYVSPQPRRRQRRAISTSVVEGHPSLSVNAARLIVVAEALTKQAAKRSVSTAMLQSPLFAHGGGEPLPIDEFFGDEPQGRGEESHLSKATDDVPLAEAAAEAAEAADSVPPPSDRQLSNGTAWLGAPERIAPDGHAYAELKFRECFGEGWEIAPMEQRMNQDGELADKPAFFAKYGGMEEWDAASQEERIAPDGHPYTRTSACALFSLLLPRYPHSDMPRSPHIVSHQQLAGSSSSMAACESGMRQNPFCRRPRAQSRAPALL